MRNFLLCLLVIGLIGCRTHYDIVMNNNTKIENVSKPKLDSENGVYRFKTATGEERTVKAMRVKTIEPHGDSREPEFKAPSQR